MSPEILAALAGLFGAVIGAAGALVTIRKMPGEIQNTESTTLQNVVKANEMLSERLQKQQGEINELRSWFTGKLEITTIIEMTNPPRVVDADIRRIPAPLDQA